ncbi:MAG TPA: hypothetical protein VJH22_04800, partial [Candidatus Nanoarchaeia archaeon]|nr:hypothetical protein [Candidatus Nanoarchaeia archaeon]
MVSESSRRATRGNKSRRDPVNTRFGSRTRQETNHSSDSFDFSKHQERLASLQQELSSINTQLGYRQTRSWKTPLLLILITLFLVASAAIVALNPSIIGFVSAPSVVNLRQNYTSNHTLSISFDAPPITVRLTGTGQGSVVLVTSKSRYVLANGSGPFENSCIDCAISESFVTAELEISPIGELALESFSYEGSLTTPPLWRGPTRFAVPFHDSLSLNLSTYFSDDEELTYLVTTTADVETSVAGEIITLSPRSGFRGETEVTLIASDGDALTRQT